MNQEETLLTLIDYLEWNKIEYFITGSFASNLHGVPRMTQDADIVVRASLNQLLKMAQDLSKDFYISEEAIREAFYQSRMFNVIHFQEGYKFDLIPLKNAPFDQSCFQRRIPIEFKGKKVYFSSAEDIILAKLRWAALSDSERQIQDAKGIVEIHKDRLDWSYLESWADQLNVKKLLGKIRPVAIGK